MKARLRGANGATSIGNIDLLKTPGAVIQFEAPNGDTQFLRIKKVRDTDGHPIEVL